MHTLDEILLSVSTTLGGGKHIHLGLVLTSAEYNLVVQPNNPPNNLWTDLAFPSATSSSDGTTMVQN